MQSNYYQFYVFFPRGDFSKAGAYGSTEDVAVQDIGARFPSAVEMLPYIPGKPLPNRLTPNAFVLCNYFQRDYPDQKWPYCLNCGQEAQDHPVVKGTREGDEAEKILSNPMTVYPILPSD